MIRQEKRILLREYKKELKKLEGVVNRAQRSHPKEFQLFQEQDDIFRENKYPDKKMQNRYNFISDLVQRCFALVQLIRDLEEPTNTAGHLSPTPASKSDPQPQPSAQHEAETKCDVPPE